MEKIIFNGQIMDRLEAKVDIEDRGYQFGDGIYEVVRVYNGKMFTEQEHLDRLFESAEKIKLDLGYSLYEISKMLTELIHLNKIEDGSVYLQFSRGVSSRQHQFPVEKVPATFVAYAKEVSRPIEMMKNGVKAKLVEDVRWLRCDIKSLNLLGNLLAKQEAHSIGCFEAILHRGDIVTEGSSSNVMIIRDGKLLTHPATNLILNGVTRRKVIEVANRLSLSIIEENFTVTELLSADEVMMTSTTAEVMPIVEIDGVVFNDGTPGDWTKKLQIAFEEEIVRQCSSVSIQS
jgi:D-alanine transaminase